MKTVMNNVTLFVVTGRSNPNEYTYGARVCVMAPLYLMVERTCGIQYSLARNTPCIDSSMLLTSWLPEVSCHNAMQMRYAMELN